MSYIPRNLHHDLKSALDAYAWPGGYPVHAVMEDGEAMCPSCVKDNLRLILAATHCPKPASWDDWRLAGAQVNWEDDSLYCAHCGKPLEPAYPPDMDVSI